SEDVSQIIDSGKKEAMVGDENDYPIGLVSKNDGKYHKLGARYRPQADNGHSQLSDSHTGELADSWVNEGLTDLGKEAVAEMNRLGIMVDVSHPSKQAMKQMIKLSKVPIIASHPAARALSDVSRNLDDEQLLWLKENGGVIQVVALDEFVNAKKKATRDGEILSIQKEVADSLGLK